MPVLTAPPAHSGEVSAAGYPSIQAALDANPGKMIFLPSGDYEITEKLRIRGALAGLCGSGRVIQQNASQPIIEIENANGAEIRDVTLTRPQGRMETNLEGILAIRCHDLVIDNVRVIDNRTRSGAIVLRECHASRVSHCLVRNYMRTTVDDRTRSPEWGYAFNCTDGSGISISYSTGILIEANRVIEENLRPTPEIKAKHKLGDYIKKNPKKGSIVSQQAWDANYTDNWQQGSGIVVTAPETSDLTRLLNNHIENAAQGIDLHADHVIVSGNLVVNSFMGMKAMHGSRNVLITSNQFVRNCLWAIGLMPGAAANANNRDGGSIIANNIVSDFGEGDAKWIWGEERSPFKFDNGQQPDDPPLSDVIITGNVIHSTSKPRYKYAVIISNPAGPQGPRGLHFSSNLFPPGSQGVSNHEMKP
jgi:Right handed beta helix region